MKQFQSGSTQVLRDGIRFTMLKPQVLEGLIFRNDRKSFHSKVDFRERIDEIELLDKRLAFPFNPTAFVRWGANGLDIGISTPGSLSKSVHPLDHSDLITVATLPYSVLEPYGNRAAAFSSWEKRAAARKKSLAQYGWKQEEHDSDLPDWPAILEHKYVFVSHKEV